MKHDQSRTKPEQQAPFVFVYSPASIARRALFELEPREAYWLLRAYGAEREGRMLTQEESKARQTYTRALVRQCYVTSAPQIDGFDAFDCDSAVLLALPFAVNAEVIVMYQQALKSVIADHILGPGQESALAAVNAEEIRLWRLAGFAVADPPEEED